jgi:hypothetical protein
MISISRQEMQENEWIFGMSVTIPVQICHNLEFQIVSSVIKIKFIPPQQKRIFRNTVTEFFYYWIFFPETFSYL